MAIYMKFGNIKGQVTTDGHKDQIELESFQFGVGRGVSSGAGGQTREGSNPSISEISITKKFDKASPKLYEDGLAGSFGETVHIYFTTTTNKTVSTYLAYELTACGVSGYSLISGGDVPNESLSLNFTKITVTPSPLSDKGSPVNGDIVSYDLSLMKTG